MALLNEMQQKAVEQINGPLLILAGAGSGKTRVITQRIAHIISGGVRANRILALTFTNKAAKEMKERICDLLNGDENVWVSTFHSFCATVLREHIEKIGYKKRFSIYDDSDSKSVVNQCIKELGLDEFDEVDAKDYKKKISKLKNDNITPESYDLQKTKNPDLAKVYFMYQNTLKEKNALDFNDLLFKTIELFKTQSDVLDYYSDKFMYIHVDEYQDTNNTQYQLLKMLSKTHGNICVVGDDDQSIYGFRGANINNILDFEKDFKNTTVIRLEQNYRSTGNILNAANAVIKNNNQRKDKSLWTDKNMGEKVVYYRAAHEREEAKYVANTIKDFVSKGLYGYNDIAVLYRANAQSRMVEEYLNRSTIPYEIYGGHKFYSRKEIKDILAYLTVMVNPDDALALERVINVPKRGIGAMTLERMNAYAANNNMSLFDAVLEYDKIGLPSGATKKLELFSNLLNTLIAKSVLMDFGEFVEMLVNDTGLVYQYKMKYSEENESKVENIKEFISVAQEFSKAGEDANIFDFLENVALVNDLDKGDFTAKKVSLMTMHSSKGLEFPVVFIVGMENNIFPSFMSIKEGKLEEERRLCYVGITRAKERLFLLNAKERMQYAERSRNKASDFLAEIPAETLKKVGNHVNENDYKDSYHINFENRETIKEDEELQMAQKVEHEKFGIGTIIKIEGEGNNRLVTVAFEKKGIRKLSTAFAPLTVVK